MNEKHKNIEMIVELMNKLHMKMHGKKMCEDPRLLETADQKHAFKRCLIDMDIYSQLMYDFLLHQ